MTLFDRSGRLHAHARVDDLDTSHEAAASVHVTSGHTIVVELLRRADRPVTHEQLVELAAGKLSPSGVRTRCNELYRRGVVLKRGETRTRSNRRAVLWGLSDMTQGETR